jgi:hypothetical protein
MYRSQCIQRKAVEFLYPWFAVIPTELLCSTLQLNCCLDAVFLIRSTEASDQLPHHRPVSASTIETAPVKQSRSVPMLKQTPRGEDGWRSGGITLSMLNLGIGWCRTVRSTSRSLYPWGNGPPYTLDTRFCEGQFQYGRFGEEENLLPLPRIEIRFHGQPVTWYYTGREKHNLKQNHSSAFLVVFISKFFGISGEVLYTKEHRTRREFQADDEMQFTCTGS